MDPGNRDRTDSVYTYKNRLIEEQPDVLNKIFVIDDKETLFHIQQKSEEDQGARYVVIEERNMSMNRNLTKELLKQKNMRYFGRLSLNNRAITLGNKNFNFFNGHEWELDISRRTEGGTDENNDDEDTEEAEEDDDDDNDNNKYALKVNQKSYS